MTGVNGDPRPIGVHLVGSIPLPDGEAVFRAVGDALGRHVRRVPDGETGKRVRWSSWTAPSYERTPGLELVDPPPGSYTPLKQSRLVIDPDELVLERLGFADAAIESYKTFANLRSAGALPDHVRFQVCLPSPVAPMSVLIEEGSRAAVEPAHIRQLHSEIDEIMAAVPHDELAIQWDVCQDVGIWEVLTESANRLTAAATRQIDWIHMPVPIDRDDKAYFAPLARLAPAPQTELYLGLIHHRDGVDGARRRIRAANSGSRPSAASGVGTRDHYNAFFDVSVPIFSICTAERAPGPSDYPELTQFAPTVDAELARDLQARLVAAEFDVGQSQE
ncbi:MAG: hypothetical protein ACRDL8_21020, partial [Solirubrobacteraceae bacterium]